MMRGGPLLILDHGVIGQGQLCPPARGCHALRCLVLIMFSQNCHFFGVPFSHHLSFAIMKEK